MSKLGIGFIGCGGIHNAHAPSLVDNDDAYIACAMDVSTDAVKAHQEKYGTKHGTTDLAEMLARDDVAAVVVCTPTGYHKDAVLAAAAAGKHILCEKPMAMHVADCEAMDAAATKAGVVLQIAFVRHFCNEWMKLRDILQDGMIGRPVVWRQISSSSGPAVPWFLDKEIGGGPFIDGAIHSYDFARFIFGECSNVVTDIRRMKAATTAWDTGTVIVNFESGDQQIVCWTWGLPGAGLTADNAHDVLGPDGCITFPGGNKLNVNLADGLHEVEFEADDGGIWFRKQMAHFLECCKTGAQPVTGAREGIAAARIADAALSIGDRPAIITL
jgi:myo-inositol 2-dehydrogenase/D-chiro-inositol 1-dehydrogenase